MTKVHIALARPRSGSVGQPTLAESDLAGKEIITSGASSVAGEVVAQDAGLVWVVTAIDGDVWVAFGEDPTAAEGSDWFCKAGVSRELGARRGEKPAAIDA